MERKMISIDLEKCNGCGACIPNCPEGALQIIDQKARLVSDLFCDGLGACVGHCPLGAMAVIEREAEPYDERKVMANIIPQGENTIAAHLHHLKDHGAMDHYTTARQVLQEAGIKLPETAPEPLVESGCPGSRVRDLRTKTTPVEAAPASAPAVSQLANWPIQLKLMPVSAPYLNGADLLIAADCVGFALTQLHQEFLRDRVLIIACPKLDDLDLYEKKLTAMFQKNTIRSVLVLHMEVPCCWGIVETVQTAIRQAGKPIPFAEQTIGISGQVLTPASTK